MLSTFSKKNHKQFAVEILSLEEQKRLKENFARITIQQVHDQKIKAQQALSEKDVLKSIRSNAAKFTEKISKQNIEKKVAAFSRSR